MFGASLVSPVVATPISSARSDPTCSPQAWDQLVRAGLVQHLSLRNRDVEERLRRLGRRWARSRRVGAPKILSATCGWPCHRSDSGAKPALRYGVGGGFLATSGAYATTVSDDFVYNHISTPGPEFLPGNGAV